MLTSVFFGMLVALIAASGSLLGSIEKKGRLLGLFIFEVVAVGLIWALIFYCMIPAFIGPTLKLGLPAFLTALVYLIVALIVSGENPSWRRTAAGQLVTTVLILLYVGGVNLYSSSFFQSDAMYRAGGKVEQRKWSDDMAAANPSHIRMVSEEQAVWLGSKVLGDADRAVGSRFHCGEYTIQRIDNQLCWVAPLEYNGFRHWQSSDGTPGYVVVNAEDRKESVRLVSKLSEEGQDRDIKMRYVRTGWFGDNIKRHIYQSGYGRYNLDIHFEVDDSWKPWWVVALTRPMHVYTADALLGVLLVDPVTGEITRYEPSEAPSWVDNVYPESLVERHISWWGEYAKGWWNAFWTKDDIVSPTTGELRMTWGDGVEPYWFTGITSVAARDGALVGFVLANSRTGQITEYKLSGADERAVIQAANTKVSNFAGYHATEPILYNLYGELAWVIPVVSDSIFQTLAIVRASDQQVVLGETKEVALAEFRKLLATDGGNVVDPTKLSDLVKISGSVQRISSEVVEGRTVYYLQTDVAPNRIFSGSSESRIELPLTRDGDQVNIGYLETEERVGPITTFDNLGIEGAM